MTTSWIASRRSLRAGGGVLSAVERTSDWSSEFRSLRAAIPVSVVARRGRSLYAFLMSWGSEDWSFRTVAAREKRVEKLARGR